MSSRAFILTKKFRRQSEEQVKLSSPRNAWIVLEKKPRSKSLSTETKHSKQSKKNDSTKAVMTGIAALNLASNEIPTILKENKVSKEKDISKFNEESTFKLHALCSSSNSSMEMIRIYTSTYPWALKQRDFQGNLPLHVAVKCDDLSYMVICELLIKAPETAQIKDKNGDLPLFLACRKAKTNVAVLRALINVYPEATRVKAYGNTALHHLLLTGCATPDNVSLLLSFNPDATRMPNSFGNLPLHHLCSSEKPHLSTVHLVLDSFPDAITYLNKAGETPIERAWTKQRKDEEMKEQVRLIFRAACLSSLSQDQMQFLRLLNWESRRIVILSCVNLARNPNRPQQYTIKQMDDKYDCAVLMYLYHTCDGVWKHIISYL